MAEYLAPGVYVEEFDSGVKAMEGVGTSTAGFLGMAVKGPVRGLPVLITSFADYQRKFGGYLPERAYGSLRFLPYAVEQFFANGGSTCYVMRVCRTEGEGAARSAAGALGEAEKELLKVSAANPGSWGNSLKISFQLNPKGKTGVVKAPGQEAATALVGKQDAYDTAAKAHKTNQDKLDEAQRKLAEAQERKKQADAAKEAMAADASDKEKTDIEKKVTEANAAVKSAQDTFKGLESPANTTREALKTAEQNLIIEKNNYFFELENKDSIKEGDLVFSNAKLSSHAFAMVERMEGSKAFLSNALELPTEGDKTLYMAEWNIAVADDTASEQYESVSLNQDRSNYIANVVVKSQLAVFQAATANYSPGIIEQFMKSDEDGNYFEIALSGGADAAVTPSGVEADLYKGRDGAPGDRTGLKCFQTISDVSIMAIPGITEPAVLTDLVTHCETMKNRFAILDMPENNKEVSDLLKFREIVDSSYAAMYHPWIQCYDMLVKKNSFMPPSGAMAGVYARTDNTRGVHKAPANETVRNCTGLSVNYNEAEQGKLNPKGVNLIRSLPGQGIRVWGARTCSSDGNWKYVNVRRLFIFIEESIRVNTNWAVFEPNDEMLWSRVEGTIRVFLTTQWRNGALAGSTAEEAFFINIGNSTMDQDDILNGRLICVIGVAPVRPAEFVIFRITQKMETAQ